MQLTHLLVPRAVIRCVKTGNLFRIVHVNELDDVCWIYDLKIDEWPTARRFSEIRNGFLAQDGDRSYELAADPFETRALSNLCNAIDSRESRAEQAWNAIRDLVHPAIDSQLLDEAVRPRLIQKCAQAWNKPPVTIKRWLKRYLCRGMTYNALLDDYANCGAPGKRRNNPGREKSGPKPSAPCNARIPTTTENERILQLGCDEYLRNSAMTKEGAYRAVILKCYSTPYLDDIGRQRFSPNEQIPSLRQFTYFLNSNYPKTVQSRSRGGERNWNLNERALLGWADADADRPGQRFQVDATVADVYLVSRFDRTSIVGRPTIYFVVDVFSRMIVGMYIGLEHPSWAAAAMALVNVVTPKREYCAKYGVQIKDEEWPCAHMPRALTADRGELLSIASADRIIRNLQVTLENTGSYRGDLKAMVERRFGIVPHKYAAFIPGLVSKDTGKRGAPDSRKKAALDIDQFTEMVIRAVMVHNHTPITNRELPTGMIALGLDATPIDLWDWGVDQRRGALRSFSPEYVALNVYPRERALVTAHGIEFEDGRYIFAQALADDWFSIARRKRFYVDVAFDPQQLNSIYVISDRIPTGYSVATQVASPEARKNATLCEISILRDQAKETRRQNRRKYLDEEISAENHFAIISEMAKEQTKQALEDRDMRIPSRENMRINRQIEMKLHGLGEMQHPTEILADDKSEETSTQEVVSDSRLNRLKSIDITEA